MVVTFVLVWLFIGALLWMLLDAKGVITDSVRVRVLRGERVSATGLILASLYVIVAWPAFVWGWVKGMM
jgi:hypothetical protein